MSDATSHGPFPPIILVGALVLLCIALGLAAGARLTGLGRSVGPESTVVDRLELHFEDRSDGAVVVSTSDPDRVIGVLEPEAHGFVRGVLRGLVRERRAHGLGREEGFQVTRWADGRLSLDDPTTGRSIDLGAFGPTNAGTFAALLVDAQSARRNDSATSTHREPELDQRSFQ